MERSIFSEFITLAVSLLLGFNHQWLVLLLTLGILLLILAFTSHSCRALSLAIILISGFLLANFSWWETPDKLPVNDNFIIEGMVSNYPENKMETGKFILKTDHTNQYMQKIQVNTAYH